MADVPFFAGLQIADPAAITSFLQTGDGLQQSPPGTLIVKVDGTTIGFNGSGQLQSLVLSNPAACKTPVRVASTGNLTLSGEQTINGVAVAAGDRVLVWAQTDPIENGIWVASAGAWARATDFDANADIISGALVPVQAGTLYDNHVFICSTNAPIVVGTDPINFTDLGNVAVTMDVNATPNTGVLRDANARAKIADPSAAGDIDNLGARNAAIDARLSAANATDLTDAGDTTLHFHSADRTAAVATANAYTDTQIALINVPTPAYVSWADDFTLKNDTGNQFGDWSDGAFSNGAQTNATTLIAALPYGYINTSTTTTLTGGVAKNLFRIGGALTMEFIFASNLLPTAAQDFTIRMGIMPTATSVVDGIFFRVQRSIFGNDHLIATTISASSVTNTDLGAYSASTAVKLKFVLNAAGTNVDFYVNGVLTASHTTDIPTRSINLAPFLCNLGVAGATAKVVGWDFVSFYMPLDTPR